MMFHVLRTQYNVPGKSIWPSYHYNREHRKGKGCFDEQEAFMVTVQGDFLYDSDLSQ